MLRVMDQLQDKDREQDERQKIERDQHGGQKLDNCRGVTITDVDDVSSTIGCHSDTAGASSLEDRGCGRDATCIRSEPDVQRRDHEGVDRTDSTQYSDVDDFVEDELGSLSNDQGLPVSHQQHFDDNGASLTARDVPTCDDVCVKGSENVYFGEKTFYNGPVTIEKIVCPNPNSTEGNQSDETPKERTANSDPRVRDQTEDPENPAQDCDKVTKCRNWTLTWRCVTLLCVMGSCMVAAIVIGVVFAADDYPKFVEREAWGAEPPRGKTEMELPVPYVFISHTAQEPCQTQSDCIARVQWVQSFHAKSRNWSDIAYSFLVGGDGYVYVGRGWDYVGAHTYGYNTRSIGISFIGTFNTILPPNRQLIVAQQLIELGVRKEKIAGNYTLLGHRQVSRTLSPGDALYSIIKTWPRWSPKP